MMRGVVMLTNVIRETGARLVTLCAVGALFCITVSDFKGGF